MSALGWFGVVLPSRAQDSGDDLTGQEKIRRMLEMPEREIQEKESR